MLGPCTSALFTVTVRTDDGTAGAVAWVQRAGASGPRRRTVRTTMPSSPFSFMLAVAWLMAVIVAVGADLDRDAPAPILVLAVATKGAPSYALNVCTPRAHDLTLRLRSTPLATLHRQAETEALRNLERSARHYGFEWRVLGLGMDFDHTGLKTELFHGALREILTSGGGGGGSGELDPGGRIVLCLDAYDVLLNAPSAAVGEAFQSMNTPILFGAEVRRPIRPERTKTSTALVENT